MKDELSVTKDKLVLRGTRICIPESLQGRAVELAHQGHQEVMKTKALIRPDVYTVIRKTGSQVRAERGDHIVTRNSSLFKVVHCRGKKKRMTKHLISTSTTTNDNNNN